MPEIRTSARVLVPLTGIMSRSRTRPLCRAGMGRTVRTTPCREASAKRSLDAGGSLVALIGVSDEHAAAHLLRGGK